MPRIRALTSITSGWSGWRRAKASNWPVSAAARAEAWTTASAKRIRLSSASPGRRSMSAEPWMTVSRLLKSCAMPPVSWPSACILCAWRSCSSALPRSLDLDLQLGIGVGERVGALLELAVGAPERPLGDAEHDDDQGRHQRSAGR